MVQQGVAVNVSTIEGTTALHEACSQGHIGCVKLLLEAGAEVCTSFSKSFSNPQLRLCLALLPTKERNTALLKQKK